MTEFAKQAMLKAGSSGIGSGGPTLILYGGAFDPVHQAHLAVARRALQAFPGAELRFIPASQSPLKTQRPQASDAQRLAMLELAISDLPNSLIDDLEIRRGGCSYTVDTVASFMEVYPENVLFWVIGADQFCQLDRWHEIERLAEMAAFLVVARPGYALRVPRVANLRYERLEMPLMEESSSDLRARCLRGESLEGRVPAEVEAFILEHRLYSSSN